MRWTACLLALLLVLAVCTARPQNGDEDECYGEECGTTQAPTEAPNTSIGPVHDEDTPVRHPHKRQVEETVEDFVIISPERRGQVAFSVTKGVETRTRLRLRFDSVLTNVGGGWNSRTSQFVAPYTGGYFFTFHALSTDNDDFTLALMKNGRYQVTAYGSPNGYQHASNSAFLTLNRRDRVHLELQEGHIYEHPLDEAYISFTGFMLYRA